MIIAIDGPAGSGKTSTARAVAEALDYTYLDTGAMYRAVTIAVLRAGVALTESAIAEVAGEAKIDIYHDEAGMHVMLEGEDVTGELRTEAVNDHVSQVSAVEAVRRKMVIAQRHIARSLVRRGGGVVIDGRDIGTVVFPEADVKIYMIASPEVRARRRYDELIAAGYETNLQEVLENVKARDEIDSSRDIAPMKQAEDAIPIDTSHLLFADQVSLVVDKALERQVKSDV